MLGRSVHRSPRAIFPFQVDNALLFTGFAGIGNVRTLHNAQLGIELLHILVEGIDLHFAGILAVVTNGERVVDQAEGLVAVVGFAVGADDLYRIVAQQLLDFFLAGLRGLGFGSVLNRHKTSGNGEGESGSIGGALTLDRQSCLAIERAILAVGLTRSLGVDRNGVCLGVDSGVTCGLLFFKILKEIPRNLTVAIEEIATCFSYARGQRVIYHCLRQMGGDDVRDRRESIG